MLYVQLDKRRSDDLSHGRALACLPLALVPAYGAVLTTACRVAQHLAGVARRAAGYCINYRVRPWDPLRPTAGYYRDAFCR